MDESKAIKMEGVCEYNEEDIVYLQLGEAHDPMIAKYYKFNPENRWVVIALNEGGYNSTEIDICQLIAWLKKHRPDLLI